MSSILSESKFLRRISENEVRGWSFLNLEGGLDEIAGGGSKTIRKVLQNYSEGDKTIISRVCTGLIVYCQIKSKNSKIRGIISRPGTTGHN